MIKINARDYYEGGAELADSLAAVQTLAAEGLDAVEISGGSRRSGKLIPSRLGIRSQDQEAYFREEALAFKNALDIPLILVGGIRSPEVAENALSDGIADYVSMCRPFIREPDLVNRWRSGDLAPAACVSDNLCFRPIAKGKGVYCLTAEREQAKK
jgi:2,4-dienoyl-CoA reductase-like NADH-dependent reductase (Old Yellow Enzyme family)